MTPVQLPSLALAALVSVVVDGVVVPVAPPARLIGGRVAAPPELIARVADDIGVEPDGTLTARRRERACVATPEPRTDPPLFPLAALARCLGAHVVWDGAAKTIALAFDGEAVVRTPAPYDPAAPRVAPTTIFTAEPAPPTPRATITGVPRPRRTPIPAIPSQPVVPPAPITPRP